jgi:CheY-like chemotaxis protein
MASEADASPRSAQQPCEPAPAPPARILLVEDDEDTRHLVALALSGQGHVVETAATPAEALDLLRRNRYALVVSDYDLPGQTGSAMLKEAAREGRLAGTAALLVTAHPQPEVVSGAGLIHKPLDLGGFLRQVGHILESMGGPPPSRAAAPPARDRAAGPPAAVALVLYVSADSPASQRARRHLESTLSNFDAGLIHLEICDVGEDPARGERDHVVFTPTLVARCGGVATWVLGDLADRTILVDLLHVCGVEPRG